MESDQNKVTMRESGTRRSLRRALWINTWMLVSLAISHRKIETCHAVATSPNHAVQEQLNLPEQSDESVELEDLAQNWRGDSKRRSPDDEHVIVVATVDGTLAGLSRRTGETLWKQQSKSQRVNTSDECAEHEKKSDYMRPQSSKDHRASHPFDNESDSRLLSPLVSTTTTIKSTSSSQEWRTAAVPSVDGRVYLTAGRGEMSGTSPKDLSASTTVQELVARAPFVDARGRFYVGSRHSTAAALDSETGEILRIVSPEQTESMDKTTLDGRNVVWLGRVDYSVSLYDARSGDSDVEFSSAEVMSVNDMMTGSGSHSADQQLATTLLLPTAGNSNSFAAASKSSLLIATPSGNVAMRDPETGQIRWVAEEAFDTPVAFAVDSSSGASLGVEILPDATVPSGSAEYLSQELERQIKEFRDHPDESGPRTIVNALSTGQLYAMPLGRRDISRASKHTHPLGLPHQHTAAASSSSALVSTMHTDVAALAGRHASSHVQDVSAHSRAGADKRKRTCNPTSPGFPGCLVGPFHNLDLLGGRSQQESFLGGENALALNQNGAVTIQYHPQLGYVAQEDMQDLQNRKKSRAFFRIMASWLPSTMILLFFLSFELGRRQRQNRQTVAGRLEDATSKMLSLDSSGAVIRDVGVIQVTEEVLGYGGHGTVVYRGMLEGRMVAVKRMLKTYHASADREISLLIESDGHPNVVRYFLKEVRGDFVYLALELCDLSLHDLIGRLSLHSEHDIAKDAVRSTLLQIASGIRHIHGLRIVHRDLKPANILLAKSSTKRKELGRRDSSEQNDECIYAHFENGHYIAKISDMGLGKQLAGQSSFGLSTLGNASLTSVSNAGGSTLGGAGPGSVGWQAPEVMVQRWTLDVSSTPSEGSSQGQDSFADASPLDAAASTRTSRSSDIFSLGCIFYCFLVPGTHPFGDWYEREANIMKNNPCIDDLSKISPDAHHLVSSMIQRAPKARPTAEQVCNHPFFWSAHRRLAFLCDVSDRLESGADLDPGQGLPLSGNSLVIERNAAQVVGIAWDKKLDDDLLDNVSRFRTYDPSSIRDCLRLIRNKHHHYDELPSSVKDRTGSNPDGLMPYFEAQFPRLVLHCYTICCEFTTADDPIASKYSIPTDGKRHMKTSSISVDEEPQELIDQSRISRVQPETPLGSVGISAVSPLVSKDVPDENALTLSTEWEIPQVGGGVETEESDEIECLSTAEALTKERAAFLVDTTTTADVAPEDIVIWEGSAAAKTFNCRGWIRSDDEWIRRTGASICKKDNSVKRCAEDPKFRTRLCNHWDVSEGTFCPMRRKNKCVFAHGPVELRVKETKRNRWGKLVDKNGNNANPCHSGGEDTYGAARSIESARKNEGKWKTDTIRKSKPKGKQHGKIAA